jgi:hypothetical protein
MQECADPQQVSVRSKDGNWELKRAETVTWVMAAKRRALLEIQTMIKTGIQSDFDLPVHERGWPERRSFD